MNRKTRFPLKLKAVIIIIALSAVLCAVSIVMSAIRFSKTNESNFKEQARDLAYTAALTVNGDDLKIVTDRIHEIFISIPEEELITSDDWGSDAFNAYLDRYAEVQEMPEFKRVLADLQKIQFLNIDTLSSIYTTCYDDAKSIVYAMYLVDAAPEDPCLPGVIEHVEDANWTIWNDHTVEMDPYITNTPMYGWLVTAYAPIFNSKGEFAGNLTIDLSMDEIKANETAFIMQLAILLVSMTAVICVIALVVIDFSVIRPLNRLSDVATGYIVDNEHRERFASLDIKRSDEIGNLSDAMKKMESDLSTYINDITVMTAEKERVGAELKIAAKMQSDILPKTFPKRGDISLYAAMTPAKEMGGDFYDFFMIDEDRMGLVMADVAGKGVPAAMFMIVAKTLMKLRTTAPGKPSEMLWDINNTLCADNPSGLFVTAWFGILTLSTGELISANAGHEYPALRRTGGEYELLEIENMPPLAAMENMEYTDEIITLGKGDELFLYTDGVPEAKAPDGSRFGTERMLEILNREKGHTPEEIVEAIKREVEAFTGDNDPFDDVTLMSVKRNGGRGQ